MSRPANIHDSFFKKVLSDRHAADTFLREHLPPDVVDLLGPEPAELLPGSFVDERLGQHHTDLLFRIQLRTKQDALTYLLMEHKSSPDEATRLQLLRYIVRILTRWYEEHKSLPLPLVLPFVAHHGPDGWKLSCEFQDLFGAIPEPLRPYTISFNHALVDFARIEDTALSAHIRLRAFLKALKYVLRSDLSEQLGVLLAEGAQLPIVDVVQILAYIGKGPVPVTPEALRKALQRLLPDRAEEIMQGFGKEYFEEGIAVGEARGQARGKAEGEAQALVRLLEKRIGAVSEPLRARIFAADLASIEAWFDRAIEATEFESVFDRN
jgi:predicted transposase/invertase (TIGR01784 family)